MQDSDFLYFQVFGCKLCHDIALIGVDEAGAEYKLFGLAVFGQGNARSRSARCDQRNLVSRQHRFFSSNAAAGSRPDNSDNLVLGYQFGSSVAGFGRLRFVICRYDLNLFPVNAAGFVEFFYSQFKTGEHALAIVRNVTGLFCVNANYDFFTCVCGLFLSAAASAACGQHCSDHGC